MPTPDRAGCPSRRRHGTRNAYMVDRCRCPAAREDYRIYRKRLREHRHHAGLVPAAGTTRRLRALAALGWSCPALAAQLGVTKVAVGYWRAGHYRHVLRTTADRIAALYDALSATPGPSTRTRVDARRRGWAPPLLWEGVDIDDPDARPATEPRRRRRGSAPRIHLDDVAHLAAAGLELDQIAARLGVAPESIQRAHQRANADAA